ncbi:beta-1,3-glucanase family protein [Streptomyces olivochromogenes]|uniref:beta-1,3-glucanase family protein n=1 Tax=Streptomyces olivochromogenes TaxID=1963 RepID=UPI0036DC0499
MAYTEPLSLHPARGTRRHCRRVRRYQAGGIRNDYAAFLHTVGPDRRAYAFPHDDIDDQSSVRILGNANPPTGLTLGIGR